MKKSLRWSVLNINITIKKVSESYKKLSYHLQEAGVSSFQSSVYEKLNTVARQVGVLPAFTDHISEVVSKGSIHQNITNT